MKRRSALLVILIFADEPGYYMVLASAVGDTTKILDSKGRWVQNMSHKELWFWINSKGGKITSRFDTTLFAPGERVQLGPLTLKTHPSRFQPVFQSGSVNL